MERNYVGIIRQMDDLGRVVIPKEIRRGMGITEGEAIEIFATDAQEIVLRRATVQEKDGILVKVDKHCSAPPTAEPIECYFENDYGDTPNIILRITPEQNKLLDFLYQNDLLNPDFTLQDGLPDLGINDLTK
jgi:AbrB family looped-hinge helix DNA binding protein